MSHIENAKREMQAAFDLGEVPPSDTMERALWRADFAIDLMYDRSPDPDDIDQPLRDLLTDLVHWANKNDVDIDTALDNAKWMVGEELKDWGLS